jgi:hypothetical protein
MRRRHCISPSIGIEQLENRTMLSASAPVLDGPTSTTDETPTLSWTGEDGAEDFEMDVYSVSLGRRVVHLPKTSATSFTFTDPLAAGTSYQVYVRDVTGGCLSPWSVHTITIEAPRVPVVIVPMTTYDTTPTIAWTDLPPLTGSSRVV